MNPPATVLQQQIDAAVKKAALPLQRMIVLGAMAGAFIALGAATSSTAAHSLADIGLCRLVSGCVFPVGLILVVLLGAELFTGNNLMAMAAAERKITPRALARNLAVVWLANLLGSLLVAFLSVNSGAMQMGGGALGAYTIKVAAGKASLSPCAAFCSGVLCNILVCTAILAAASSKHVAGKIPAVYIPIFAFVVGGFEHCVANMYYLPAGWLAARNPDWMAIAAERWGIGAPTLLGICRNLIWATLGNMAGGVLAVAMPVWFARREPPRRHKAKLPKVEFAQEPPPAAEVANIAGAEDDE